MTYPVWAVSNVAASGWTLMHWRAGQATMTGRDELEQLRLARRPPRLADAAAGAGRAASEHRAPS